MGVIGQNHERQMYRQALISAAAQVFARNGYERSTVREIAAAAGCAEGLVHRYFNGKHGLLEAVLAHRYTTAESTVAELPLKETLEEELRQFLYWYVDSIRGDQATLILFISQVPFDRSLWPIVDQYRTQHTGVIVSRLKPHQERGEICPEVDLQTFAVMLTALSMDIGLNLQTTDRWDGEYLRNLASGYVRVLLSGLRCRLGDGAHCNHRPAADSAGGAVEAGTLAGANGR
jgi:AcrR family transcriptional regulator